MVLPCLMTALNSIGGGCFGWAGDRIQAEAGHLIAYEDNIESLRAKVQDLSDAIKAVEHRIQEAANIRGATLVAPTVETLLKRMAYVQEEASKLIADEERSSDSRCLMGLRPNLWACYRTSKLARKAIDEAGELLEKEKKLDMPVANVDFSESLGVKPILEFEEFESRVLVSNQIVAALKDPNVSMVGVYGMGGVGKTTLAEKIGADLQTDCTFSFVVLATVSEKHSQDDSNFKPDMLNIQKQIAEGFKIELRGETLRNRAAELDKHLQKKDKVLIILDDIWSRFQLKDVGIPVGNAHRSFKILMTSRSEAVLRKEMNSTKKFGLDSLPHPDAVILFDRMVGVDSEHSKWRPTAEQVVKQCGGIPIILVTIARALRNEDSKSWEDALTQLKQFDGESILEEPYKMIEVSYKFLKVEELKRLLLLCAQLNHRAIEKDDLLKYAMGLNLFKGCKTLKEVSNRLHRYLSELKGCCLLQDGKHHGVVKMHDVVHKFASSVALRDHHVFSVANGDDLEDWPSKDELEHFYAISLPECHLPPDQMLPAAFDNPDLESFLMLRGECAASLQIPDNFFVGMKGLRLMHLTRMSLSPALVSSFEALVKLRTLCLDGCKLSDISVIGELQNLQAISLVGSSIVLLPPEMGKLGSTLKLLDLRECKKLKRIAAGVVSRLTLLEDLRIGKSFTTWQRLEGNHNKEEIASMEEFKNLQNLINVEIEIKEHAFPKELVFKKLEAFKIFFGNERRYLSGEYISTRTLEVHASTTVEFDKFDGEGSKALLTSAECLLLAGVIGSATVSEMDGRGFPELKHLKVRFVKNIQYIVKKSYKTCIFPKLETLEPYGLFKLERICDHPLPVGSFENLRVLQTSRCHLLKGLLTANLARGLLNLKEIKVAECDSMESIIVENEEEEVGFTHQLRALKLYTLPHFMSFCGFKQLEELPSPTTLFNKKIMFPKLEVLELMWLNIEKIWDDRIVITAEGTYWLQNLTMLIVNGCDNLSYLFTSSTVKCFAQLKSLNVSMCDFIEEIVVATCEGEVEGDRLLLFPKLESLHLYNLPKLKIFCPANLLECQSLQNLDIFDCPLLNGFIGGNGSSLFDEEIIFPKLEKLRLRKLKIEKIWDFHHLSIAVEETTGSFQNLTSLEVEECGNLSHMFPSSMVESLANLKQLQVRKCESVEEIVGSMERATSGDVPLSFPKLDSLQLECLPKLKRFCEANLLECQVLRELVIKSCSELIRFVASFNTAKSLVNLKEMHVAECDSLEEIVGIDDQWDSNGEYIVFEKLEVLHLRHLNSLTSFCSTPDCNFRFPSLNRLYVSECPKLKLFSMGGDLSTPNLLRVCPFSVEEEDEERTQNEGRWEGDLNSTIRHLSEEKVTTMVEVEHEDEDEVDIR